MAVSRLPRPVDPVFPKSGYAVLRNLSVNCRLTRTDRRALADHIQRADRIGTGVHTMLARLLSQKLLYTPVVEDGRIGSRFATGGARLSYAIDDLEPQSGHLLHETAPGSDQDGLPVASLLGATLIGMQAGSRAPLLQADGSFRRLWLIGLGDSSPRPGP